MSKRPSLSFLMLVVGCGSSRSGGSAGSPASLASSTSTASASLRSTSSTEAGGLLVDDCSSGALNCGEPGLGYES